MRTLSIIIVFALSAIIAGSPTAAVMAQASAPEPAQNSLAAQLAAPWRHLPKPVSDQQFKQDQAKCKLMGHMAPVGEGSSEIKFLVVFIECMKAQGYEPVLAAKKPPPPAGAEPYIGAVDAYLRGDFATTIRLMRPLADQGDANAQFILAGAYYAGQNYNNAIHWYRRAANQGHADAQSQLGEMYLAGQGVPQSYVEARLWFSLAAINPTTEKKSRQEAVHNRNLVASKMTAAQIAEAQRLESAWKPKPER